MLKDDSKLRAEGKNIVISYDCGRYSSAPVTLDEDVKPILYGKVSKDDESKFKVGRMGNYQIRNVYCTENSAAPKPGVTGIELTHPAMDRHTFVGWYVASVIKWKTNEDGEFLRNKYGQKVYDYCIPQESDIAWDFNTMRVGTYEDHPYAQVFTLKDYENFDINNIGPDDLVEETDESLGYNAESGYNIYLYAKWKHVGYFVVMWHSPITQQWEEVKRFAANYSISTYKPSSDLNISVDASDYTFYKAYKDAAYQELWDETATFDSFTIDEKRPYIRVYAKYLVGKWNVVRTKADLNKAIFDNKNIYLDSDIEYSGEAENDRWKHSFKYTAEFNGNNHTITFNNACIPKLGYKTEGGPAQTSLFGLIGEFSGKMYDVTFINVDINVKFPYPSTIYTGVLFGSIREGAELNNIVVSGKLTFQPEDSKNSWNEYEIYSGGEIYTGEEAYSWYGAKDSDTVYDVTFTLIP
jgi:hypothetical protein